MPEGQNNMDIWRGKVSAHLEHLVRKTDDIEALIAKQEAHCENYRGFFSTDLSKINGRIRKLENETTRTQTGSSVFWNIAVVVGTAFCMALAMWLFGLI